MGKDLSEQGSHMVGGRTYRNVPTTNNTEPVRPAYPAVRKPATGPMITTSDIDRDVEDMSKDKPILTPEIETKKKPGRKPKERS